MLVVKENEVIYNGDKIGEVMTLLPNFMDISKEKYRVYEISGSELHTYVKCTENASQSPIDSQINGIQSYVCFPSRDLGKVIDELVSLRKNINLIL